MDDLISKLSEIRSDYNCFDEDGEPYYRALSEAIRILSQRADGDTISRQAAIDTLDEQIEQCNKALGSFDISPKDEYAVKVERASLEAYKEQLENMPSAQPETATVTIGRTRGGVVMWYECDACGEPIDQKDCYCRNCGRKLTLPEPYRGGDSNE